jgi:hypothetical protein
MRSRVALALKLLTSASPYPSTDVGAAKEEPADGEEDIDADETLAQRDESPAPLVFCSMQEVEAYWHEQALYISDVCGIDEWSARQLLKEYAHDADAAIKGFLANVRSFLPCSSHFQHSPDRTRSYWLCWECAADKIFEVATDNR